MDGKDGAARETQIRRAGRSKAVTFSIRRPWDVIGQELLSPFSLPASCFPPSLTKTADGTQSHDCRRSMAPRENTVYVCVCVWVFAVLEPASGRPRPRTCCGSPQWTGARQDVTLWRRLAGHRRTERRSVNVLCPAHLINSLKGRVRIKSTPLFWVVFNPGLKHGSFWWTRCSVINAVREKLNNIGIKTISIRLIVLYSIISLGENTRN